jgi:hypothetical protein
MRQRLSPVAQRINQLFRLANFAVTNRAFSKSECPPAA